MWGRDTEVSQGVERPCTGVPRSRLGARRREPTATAATAVTAAIAAVQELCCASSTRSCPSKDFGHGHTTCRRDARRGLPGEAVSVKTRR